MLWYSLYTLLSLSLLHTAASTPRKLEAYVDPFCDGLQCGLCYVRSEGSKDTLHHMWSTRGVPALLTISTAPEGRLTDVHWDKIRDHDYNRTGFNFSEPSRLAYALLLTKLWEVPPHNETKVPTLDLSKLEWTVLTGCSNDSTSVSAVFTANGTSCPEDRHYFAQGGTVRLTMTASADWGYGSDPPGLLRGPDNSEIQLELNGLVQNVSQWAVEMTLAGNWNATDQPLLSTQYTLDDYRAPGVFRRMELASSEEYASWRPVSYGDAAHSLTQSSKTTSGEPAPGGDTWRLSDVLSAYAARHLRPECSSVQVFLGSSKGYVSWGTTAGVGTPPSGGPSAALIGAFAVGAALLALSAAALLLLFLPTSCRREDDERLLVA